MIQYFYMQRISNGLKQQLDLKTRVGSSLDHSHNFYMILSPLRVRATGVSSAGNSIVDPPVEEPFHGDFQQ
jgi:hypothetical protein